MHIHLLALYGGIDMHGTWIPEVIKGIFGAVLGLISTVSLVSRQPHATYYTYVIQPLLAALALGLKPQMPGKKKIASTTQILSSDTTFEMSDDVEPSSQSHVLSPGAKKELGDDQVE
jgi:hypothetical protein